MELLQLKYFQTVAQLEHMTKAAEKLEIAQPSLSITIARLEDQVGVPLFDRQGRNIRLNAYGKLLLQRVDRIFEELEAGLHEIRDLAQASDARIRLGISASNFLPYLMSAFLSKYPNVQFQQVYEPTFLMKQMLEEGALDLCLTMAPMDSPELEKLELRKVHICIIVPKNHRLADRKSVSLIELKDESFISMGRGFWFQNYMDKWCQQAGFAPRTTIEVSEIRAMEMMLQKGLGIFFSTDLLRLDESQSRDSVKIRISDPGNELILSLYTSKKRYLSQAAKQFRQFCADFFEKL
jgi:Transcriptional regulator